ncbi:MAG: T9SS type A sorting domain-containing protein [Sphingobacteriales bacterium]|nr:MAG: T9SS type A sorting domain-containing protein [Sphingobacteriales bacterium]
MKIQPLRKLALFFTALVALANSAKAQTGPPPTYNFYAYNETFNYLTSGTVISSLSGQDDLTATSIPIGFNFLYAGSNYSQLSVNTNGWISFNNFSTTHNNDNPNLANLNSFGPCLLPLWEDISNLYGTLSYATSGTAPNRVFTLEYKNAIWDYLGSSPCITFQVRLYEGGVIKYHYKQESGSVNIGTSGGCSIGIGASSSSWQFLDNSSTAPTTTSSSYTSSNYQITTRPATGQVYQFGDFPCAAAPVPSISSKTSTSATITWAAMLPSVNYEYAFNTTGTPPATGTPTTATSYSQSGLTPATMYYFHIRNKCTPTTYTIWQTIPVETYPPCTKPVGLTIKNLYLDSATVVWRKLWNATGYEYVVNTDRTDPNSTTTTYTTPDTTFGAKNLQEGVKYYVHIKIKCLGGESSAWSVDSFTTPVKCRPPHLTVDYQHIDRAIVYWNLVPSAWAYEYEISQSPTPMGKGTEIKNNSFLAFPMKPGEVYYFHARSKCLDQNVRDISEWGTTSFKTFPLSVSDNRTDGFALKVYPNPAKDMVTLEVSDIPDADARIYVYDIAGKQMAAIPVDGKKVHQVQLGSYAPGVYTIKYTDKAHTETTRITRQ